MGIFEDFCVEELQDLPANSASPPPTASVSPPTPPSSLSSSPPSSPPSLPCPTDSLLNEPRTMTLKPSPSKPMAANRILSDIAASQPSLYAGLTSAEESNRRFALFTGREVTVADGSIAFARGYTPQVKRDGYLHPPKSNVYFPGDDTSFVPNKWGLIESNSANVPLVIAWIDDARVVIPHPATLIVPTLCTPSGEPELSVNGEILRDFKVLPRYISSAVEGWRLHYWFTLDKRIGYADVLARMRFKCSADGGEGPLACGMQETVRFLHARIDQFRREAGILAPLTEFFNPDTYVVTGADTQVVSNLTKTQLEYGTWWTVDEIKGVMYPPKPKDKSEPWKLEQHLLPIKGGISPRVHKILEYCQPKPELQPQRRQIQTPQPTSTPISTSKTPTSSPSRKRPLPGVFPKTAPIKRSRSESTSLSDIPFFHLGETRQYEVIQKATTKP